MHVLSAQPLVALAICHLAVFRNNFRDDVMLPGTERTTENEGTYSRILLNISALSLFFFFLLAFLNSLINQRWTEILQTWEMPHWMSSAVPPAQNSGHWQMAGWKNAPWSQSKTLLSFWRALLLLFQPSVNLPFVNLSRKRVYVLTLFPMSFYRHFNQSKTPK